MKTSAVEQHIGGRVKRTSAIDQEVGRRLKAFRIRAGLSQTEVGDGIRVTFQQIQKYEKGTNRIAAGHLWELSVLLRIGIAEFFPPAGRRNGDSAEAFFDLVQTTGAHSLLENYALLEPGIQRMLVALVQTLIKERK